VQLKDWSPAHLEGSLRQALITRLSQHFGSYKDAVITPINPPPIRGWGPPPASTSSSRTAAGSATIS